MSIGELAIGSRRIFDAVIGGAFLALAGMVLPLLLLPLVQLGGHSEIIEEAAKSAVILFVILKLPSIKWQIYGAIVFGLMFGISENMLYLSNYFKLGLFDFFWWRFMWTVPMHSATALIILFSVAAGKKWLILGLLGAIALHLMFNALSVALFT